MRSLNSRPAVVPIRVTSGVSSPGPSTPSFTLFAAMTDLEDLVRLGPVGEIPIGSLKDNIGSEPGEIRLSDSIGELLLALVEFVIAEYGQVVAHPVVDVDRALAHQELGDRRRREVDVTGIHHHHVSSPTVSSCG